MRDPLSDPHNFLEETEIDCRHQDWVFMFIPPTMIMIFTAQITAGLIILSCEDGLMFLASSLFPGLVPSVMIE